MNIGNGIERLPQVLSSQETSAAAPKAGVTGQNQSLATDRATDRVGDRAEISAAGTKAAESAGASDVRLDKVASIQSALEAGTYQVPASEVAKKIVTSLLNEG